MSLVFSTLRISVSKHLHLGSGSSITYLVQSRRIQVVKSFGKNSRFLSSSVSAEAQEFEHDGTYDEARATEKDTALHLAISQLTGDTNTDSRMSMQRFFGVRRHIPVIPTGSLKLDLALGVGGLPKGRFVEIYGQEGSGKTTLALHIIKEAQKLGGFCAYFDVENALDPPLAEAMGLDTENLLISRPDSAENILSAVDTLTKSGSVDVIVVDSIAALVPQYEVDVSISDVKKDFQSRIMTQALRKIHYSLHDTQTLIVLVNQVRSTPKPGSEHIMVEETCGGKALKFYAAVRLKIRKTGLLQTANEVTGLGVSIQVVKNKLAPAMKKAELGLHFGKGFCSVSEVLDLGCEHGIILNEGSNYFIQGKVFSDQLKAKRYLSENDGIVDNLVSILRSKLFDEGNTGT